MKFIDRHDIENWAQRYDSKGYLPYLISRLVRSTTPLETFVEFPDGSSTFVGGWDGKVICKESTPYVPEGTSLWEFGTEANTSGKAEEDIAKRSFDTLGYNPKECTLIIVTPRFFKKKDEFRQEKVGLGIWRDVLVYDSRNLEEWLEVAPAPSRWFSSYIKKYPADGIITIEEFWKEWSIGPDGVLPTESITTGREYESKQLLNFLRGAPGIKAIHASSKEEAVAFIIASSMQFEEAPKETFASKALVVDTPANFRSIRINQYGLNLIAKFDDPQILFAGVADGHHVLVPLGADNTFNQEIMTLPLIDRDGLVEALKSMGLSESEAAKYSKECARNITVLKRLLKFPQNQLAWAAPEYARDIIPGMLIGRWNKNRKGDVELIEKLAEQSYEDYIGKIAIWKGYEVPPFIKIGETWRLTSPLDAWANLAPHVTIDDLYRLKWCFMEGYSHGNPIIEPENSSSPFRLFLAKENKFSDWAREGLVQSLILIGLYGEGLRIPELKFPKQWVDEILFELLNDANGELWISLDHEMPMISEASPTSFFNALFASLSKSPSPIMKMFGEKDSFLFSSSNHTGLLWALEGLAWEPEYFRDATVALGMLAQNDPGGQLANRPINSLIQIFKPWHYQTLATFEERMAVLQEIAFSTGEIGWTLLLNMLPEYKGVGQPTHKMRWRMFDHSFDKSYTYQEVWDTHSRVIQILVSIFDYTEGRLSDLLNEIDNISKEDRDVLLTFITSELGRVKQSEYTAWHTIRNKLSYHRSNPEADWVLPENELKKLQSLCDQLEPKEGLPKYQWLFEEHWPNLPEGNPFDNDATDSRHDQLQKIVNERRIRGLKSILDEYGIDSVISLSETVKEPGFLGDTLAKVLEDKKTIIKISKLVSSTNENVSKFVQSFIFRLSILKGEEWIFQLFNDLQKEGMEPSLLARLLIPLSQTKSLWTFLENISIESKEEYWLNMQPNFYQLENDEKILGIQELMNNSRYISALKMCYRYVDDIPSTIIVEVLERAATTEIKERTHLRPIEINRLFESIESRKDISREKLIQLEWLFLSVLASYRNKRSPRILHDELANNPEFFLDILKWVYMPKNKQLLEEERQGLSDELIQNRAKQAYKLLKSWKKIPGTNDKGEIDNDHLINWITEVRDLAEKADRLNIADVQIGKVLAQYPERNLDWPPDEICSVIESINTDSIKRSFSSTTHNKRGFSTRGPYDGGNIERAHAEHFQKLAQKHRRKYPNVSIIFDGLAAGYLREAKDMDEQAERDKLEI